MCPPKCGTTWPNGYFLVFPKKKKEIFGIEKMAKKPEIRKIC
jgi:hypothetical protein